jgi:uncharacterized membrane protein
MGIEWLRDFFLIILSITLIVVSIFLAVVAYQFSQRARIAMTTISGAAKAIQNAASAAGNQVIMPLAQISAIVHGVQQGIQEINKLFGKRKGDGNG